MFLLLMRMLLLVLRLLCLMASLVRVLGGRCKGEERGQEHVGTSRVAQYVDAVLLRSRHCELPAERQRSQAGPI